jgi:hypothetical protein
MQLVPEMRPIPAMQPPPGDRLRGIVYVEKEARKRRELQERRARVEQQPHALAWQQLAALREARRRPR